MKKVTTAVVQNSATNTYINIPKIVREMFNIQKGDVMEVYIDSKTEEIKLKKVK